MEKCTATLAKHFGTPKPRKKTTKKTVKKKLKRFEELIRLYIVPLSPIHSLDSISGAN